MLRTEPIAWKAAPSPIDGIEFPNVELADAGRGDLAFVVSEWRDGKCLAAFTAEFRRPEAYSAMEEAAYSISSPDQEWLGQTYVRFTETSETTKALSRLRSTLSGREVALRHYQFVGLSECFEVVAEIEPAIKSHETYEAAIEWSRRRRDQALESASP
jgi:hypothetical protein